jgi:hypothetical protein
MHLLFPFFNGPTESALYQVAGVFVPIQIDVSIKGRFEKCDQHQNPVTDVRVLLDVGRKILLFSGCANRLATHPFEKRQPKSHLQLISFAVSF